MMLDKIKERVETCEALIMPRESLPLYQYDGHLKQDLRWLIADNERLQRENVGLRNCDNCNHHCMFFQQNESEIDLYNRMRGCKGSGLRDWRTRKPKEGE